MKQKTYAMSAKKRKQDFTRKRKMTCAELLYFMLGMVKEWTLGNGNRLIPEWAASTIHRRTRLPGGICFSIFSGPRLVIR
jgi:hypothetical protein